MLEKILGIIIAEQMWSILLLKANFNSYNGMLLAKRMIDQAMENNWIPQELYATKGNESVEVTLNWLLVADLSRLWRVPLAMPSVNANTCYDWAAHAMAALTAQRWAVEQQAIGVMLMTIQLMLFFICTGFSDSQISFGHSGTPLQGLCQGNKGAPAMWLCISTALVNMMHAQGHTTTIQMAITAVVLTIMGFLLVNDTDLVILGESASHLAHQAVHSMVWASIKYPLPATTMTHQQGSEISSILFTTVLPKLGAVHSFPKVYRYAPMELQGLALHPAKVEQEINHIHKILTHGAIDIPTGILFKAMLKQAQLEVGSREPFLSLPLFS